jgi:glycosyltransferase involved in cell wall biosynthesis
MFNEQDSSNLYHSEINVSCIARLVPQKDLPTLLKAISLLGSRGIFASVKIAGSGPDLEDLKRLSADLNLDHQVEFVGRIEWPEKFIGESDVFVLPSLFEGFGLVLLEAAAAGVPAIAARNTAMAEVIVDRESGLLFSTGDEEDLANKIEELANDDALRRKLARDATVRLATTFSVHHMVKETSAIYEEVLREREVGAR